MEKVLQNRICESCGHEYQVFSEEIQTSRSSSPCVKCGHTTIREVGVPAVEQAPESPAYTGWIHAGRVEAGMGGRNYVWVMENEYWKEGLLVRRGRTQSDEYTRHDEACAGLTLALAGAVQARGGEVG